jgi:hypothetical protein
MTTDQAQKAGQRAARAEARGDELAARTLFRDVIREATRLRQRDQADLAIAVCVAYGHGHDQEEEV